jgi:2-oxoisovalerate/pyruvate ferredoxin oxidoreductase gamma subunit
VLEIRIHGRGGQGAVVASKVLATAVYREGKFVQSFPSFGVERRGAPVTAFTRIDDAPIRLRCEICTPDHLIILDPTLLEAVDVTAGLRQGGWILVNSAKPPTRLGLPDHYLVATVDASAIARRHRLGPATAPIVNTAILGAFAAITHVVGLEALCAAVREAVPVKQDANVAATEEAYERVRA